MENKHGHDAITHERIHVILCSIADSRGRWGGGPAIAHMFFNKPPFLVWKNSSLRAFAINDNDADTLSSAPPPFKISESASDFTCSIYYEFLSETLSYTYTRHLTFSTAHWHTPREVRGFNPHWIFRIFWNCVFAKCTVRAPLPYSLGPKFSTGKRLKLYTNYTFCFSFCGTASPRLPTGPLDLTGKLPFPRPNVPAPPREPLIIKSWVRLWHCR